MLRAQLLAYTFPGRLILHRKSIFDLFIEVKNIYMHICFSPQLALKITSAFIINRGYWKETRQSVHNGFEDSN